MPRLRFLTAGESHGPMLCGILDGVPAGVPLDSAMIRHELSRRRITAGRSARQAMEGDDVEIVGGVRAGTTTGAPIAMLLKNAEAARWADVLAVWSPSTAEKQTVPRPGHADLAGLIKYDLDDVRDVLERASARETAMRTALSTVARALLLACDITVNSEVISIGGVAGDDIAEAIDDARKRGDTLGGRFCVRAYNVPVGLGSYSQWDRRLSTQLMASLASIHAIKSVAICDPHSGDDVADRAGNIAHDVFDVVDGRAHRTTNYAGGIEGGMSNGAPIVLTATMKPLSTVPGGLPSLDISTGGAARGLVERSDTTAVYAAAVVGEAMLCLSLADALLTELGGDSLAQVKEHVDGRRRRAQRLLHE